MLQDLLRIREAVLFNKFVDKMSDKSSYDIMMKHVSDEMQDLATAYGSRLSIEQCIWMLIQNSKTKKTKICYPRT
jgi:hypothetical protein